MNIAGLISRPLYWVFGKVFSVWARPAIQPENPAEYITSSDAAVCYVLETGGLADVLALERSCALQGMPSPTESFEFCGCSRIKAFHRNATHEGILATRSEHDRFPQTQATDRGHGKL